MSKQFDKSYDPKKVEDKIYRLWEKSGYFNPDNLPASKVKSQKSKVKSFCIIMPPPNANEALHLGQALTMTLEDIMIRFNRMRGKKTLWLPGSDHAGFETQVVFEKKLEKEGKSRFDFDGKTLYKMIWDYVQSNKHMMESQTRALGASCDWSREKFTLDPQIVKIVYGTFKKLYDDGLVYRGKRVINWCPKHQTSFSELEVKYEEREDKLWYIKYPFSSGKGYITVATTRPETMLGDTAVAVNPKDKRYKDLIGKKIKLPLTEREIPIIADSAVEMDFGTGAVKITPAHDQTDFEISQRHNLEILEVIGKNGKMASAVPLPYRDLKTSEAREKIVKDLKSQSLLEKEELYKHMVGSCYKCGRTIEPMLSKQWFVKIKPLADKAVEAVKKGQTKFISRKYEKIFFHWMKIFRDWNISRQIVWGIRIPAWYCMRCSNVKLDPEIKAKWYLVRHGETDWNIEGKHQGHAEVSINKNGIKQVLEVVRTLKDKNIDLIISSDLKRCEETTEIIARELKIKDVIYDKNIRELDNGEWQGLTHEEIQKKYGSDSFNARYDYGFRRPGGESWEDLEKRVLKAFNNHLENHKHHNVVIISHGGPMRTIKRTVKNIPYDDADILGRTKNAEIFELTISKRPCQCGSDLIEQDPDVFDTWFSSGMWPFATLMASGPKDFDAFYPTSVMETGWDILPWWVARMIMLGIYFTGKVPFKYIYLHGMIRDKDKQKMSKSKGNVINPLGVIEERGADALRMSLIFGSEADSDVVVSEDKVIAQQRFANKIWNASKFVLANLGDNFNPKKIKHPKYTKKDKWILKELQKSTKKITADIEKFHFHQAAQEVYHFFWHKFCDKTIEDVKKRISENTNDADAGRLVLWTVLYSSLKLLHPFMPFITEEIYQQLPVLRRGSGQIRNKKLLMIEEW